VGVCGRDTGALLTVLAGLVFFGLAGVGMGGSRLVGALMVQGRGSGSGGVLAGFAAGSRVAGYLLEEQVGAGGMAVVFRARDERLSRLVALKVLAPAMAADDDFRARFIRESRAAAAVEDPHIIPVHEAGEDGGVLFIAMRFVPGGDVRSLARRSGPLSPAQVAAIISPVASALDSAHAAGLVHRDVKPANMLLDVRPGRPDHVYLSDFGLSKGMMSVGLTGSGHFLGTPGYSAPEQIQGLPVDGRADQYALACTAFELLGGTAVFARDEVVAMMYAHLWEPPPLLTSRRPGTPAAADAVFARALAKEPGRRYPGCQEFADALRAAFALPAFHASYETGPRLSHPPQPSTPHAGAAVDPAATRSARRPGLREAAPGHRRQARLTRRAVLGLTGATAAAAGGLAIGWDLTRHHTTTTPHAATTRTPPGGTTLWTTTIPSPAQYPVLAEVQAVGGGIVYAVGITTTYELYALNSTDGRTLWHHPGGAVGTPRAAAGIALAGRTIYALTESNFTSGLSAYDARSGTLSWKLPTFRSDDAVYGPVVVSDSVCLTASGQLLALNRSDGQTRWTFSGDGTPGGLTAAGGTVYLATLNPDNAFTSDGTLYAVRSGKEVWRFSPRGAITAGPVIAAGLVYITTYSGGVYALRADNGDQVWNFGASTTAPGLGYYPDGANIARVWVAGGIVYTGGQDRLRALRAADGTELWSFPVGGGGFGITIAGNSVFVGNETGEVYALSSGDGAQRWRLSAGNSRALVYVNGTTAYIGSNDLHAVRAADGKRLWDFPESALGLAEASGVVYVSVGSSIYALHA
jgi:outer membrane protein assembly factor BamB